LKNNKGFTLVELLVTLGLITIITFLSSDFLINLVSSSVRIQNKASLEQSYSLTAAKLVKMIEEADNVSISSATKMIIVLEGVSYTVDLLRGQVLINNISISSADNLLVSQIGNQSAFSFVRSSNPQQIKLNLKFSIGDEVQELERIVTVRKSYKN
jgi:prepilin-type N-terminal cleavage/methylation domain-containing protein